MTLNLKEALTGPCLGRRALHAGAMVAVVAVLGCGPPADTDYLDPDLRARVDALKAQARDQPTSAENALERCDVLWDWANAYALDGGPLPVLLSGMVASIHRIVALAETPPGDMLSTLDDYIAELSLRDDDPRAVGTLSFPDARPLVAGSFATIEQVYTVGSVPMRPGGMVALGMQRTASIPGRLQIDDPTGKNFVTVRSSSPSARFNKTEAALNAIHGAGPASPAFEIEGATLEDGETITVTYGDTSGGGPGLEIQPYSTAELLLPIYVALDADGLLLSSRWPGLEVLGAELAGVGSFAPSVVAPGEPFSITVRAEDRWGNRATGPLPAWEVLSGGERVQRIEAGGPALTVVENLRLAEPGVHRLEIVSEDRRYRALANPILVRDGDTRLVWGETHVHSGYAEGQGTAEEVYRFAQEDARLDFLGYSEHDAAMDAGEWATVTRLVQDSRESGSFVAFLGYEWTVERALGGHHNVFFRNPDQERVWSHDAPQLADLYRGLRATSRPEDVIVIPHAHQSGDWTQSDPELERAVEIHSAHGSFESFGNQYLRNGWMVGFVGASDDHRAKPGSDGLAALWVPERTPGAIFDGLRSMSSYATSGERIVLEAELNGSAMGTRQPASAERRLKVRVAGTSPIERIDVVRNGELAYGRDYLTAPLRSDAWVQIGFESSTVVQAGERDNPRGFRQWKGSLEVQGASLVEVAGSGLYVATTGLYNVPSDYVRLEGTGAERVLFKIDTRGRRDSFLLRLHGASPSTRFVVRLEETVERGTAQVPVRRPATIPAIEIRLDLADLVAGRLEHPLTVDVHTDLVTVHVLDPEGPFDREFEWVDLGEPGDSDYYYVRVTQLDGGRAWSSPFWVGLPSPSMSAPAGSTP